MEKFIYNLKLFINRSINNINKLRVKVNNLNDDKKRLVAASLMFTSALMLILSSIATVKYTPIVAKTRLFLNSNGIYTEPVKKTTFKASNDNYQGDWQIDRTTRWKARGMVEVTYNLSSVKMQSVNDRDVLFVVDNSEGMSGAKLDRVQRDLKQTIYELINGTNNRAALVSFNETGNILSGFSSNITELYSDVNGMTASGERSYNAGLQSALSLLNTYQKQAGTDLVMVFITDGRPTREVSAGNATYLLLKDTQPALTINAIQLETGNMVYDEVVSISDNQFISSNEMLRNTLNEVGLGTQKYDYLDIFDTINNSYFHVTSTSSITANGGVVNLKETGGKQTVEWKFDNYTLATGNTYTMKVEAMLNDGLINQDELFPLSEKIQVKYKLPNDVATTKEDTTTNVLKTRYKVNYKSNQPYGCNVADNIPAEEYSIYDTVTKKTSTLTCGDYLFDGWELDDNDAEDMQIINSNTFIMPEHDVTIRATWKKHSLKKSVTGDIFKTNTLYNAVRNEYGKVYTYTRYNQETWKDEEVEYTVVDKYDGAHKDSYTKTSKRKIYYYSNSNFSQNRNNVIFNGFCWHIIRTTDTGGVKLMYNGKASANNTCEEPRSGYNVGYEDRDYKELGGHEYVYGTSYSFDYSTGKFTVTGDTVKQEYAGNNTPQLFDKYTCMKETQEENCAEIYYVESAFSAVVANVYPINTTTNFSQVGTMVFNDFEHSNSIGNAGYMNNNNYNHKKHRTTLIEKMYEDGNYVNRYTYGTSYTYSGGKYTIHRKYTVPDPNWNSWEHPDEEQPQIEKDEPITVSRSGYEQLKGMYVCKNAVNNQCDEIMLVVGAPTINQFEYTTSQYPTKFASSYTYSNGTFTLTGSTANIWDYHSATVHDTIDSKRYTCLDGTTSCEKLSYVLFMEPIDGSSNGALLNIIELTNSKTIPEMYQEMLYNQNVNTNDSTIKRAIEKWYEIFMKDQSKYLEDTIFCNDRRIPNDLMFKPTGGSVQGQFTYFYEGSNHGDLSCSSNLDQFSINNSKAKLKYPIGLMTKPEFDLQDNGETSSFITGYEFWLMSPEKYGDTIHMAKAPIEQHGTLKDTGYSVGVRPVISLKPGVGITTGDGSYYHPYMVDMD